MTFVGIMGLLIGLLAAPFAFPNRPRDRYLLGYLLLGLHLAATVIYYNYSLTHDSDPPGYYYDPLGMFYGPRVFGTVFTVKLVQTMRRAVGGGYFEYFIFFQAIGFIGLVFLTRIFADIEGQARLRLGGPSVAILMLPSIHFWTSSIGKDAPLFLACSLAAWSAVKMSSRWFVFALAVCIMIPFRPHIGFIAVISVMLALVLDSRFDLLARVSFLSVALVSASYLVGTIGRTYRFDATDPNSVADFFHGQQNMTEFVQGSTNVQGGFVVKLLSLMLRPMFIDAQGAFGMISSFENLVFLFGFICLIMRFKQVRSVINIGIFYKYCLFFTVILTILLATVYYNVGLGLRQRVMIYPTLLPMFVVAWALWKNRGGSALAAPLPVSPAIPSQSQAGAMDQ